MNPPNQNLQFSASSPAMPEGIHLSKTDSNPADSKHDLIDADLERRLNAIGSPKTDSSSNRDQIQDLNQAADSQETALSDLVDSTTNLDRFLIDESCLHHSCRTLRKNVETVTQYFRIRLQPEQIRSVLQIPFYPSLDSAPEIVARAIEFNARIRITQRERFGVRLEIVADKSSQMPKTVVIEVVGTAELDRCDK